MRIEHGQPPDKRIAERMTSGSAVLPALAGDRNPCLGPLGAVAAGARADRTGLDDDPIADIHLMGEPDQMPHPQGRPVREK